MPSSKSTKNSAQTELSTKTVNSFSTAGDFRRCLYMKPVKRDEQGEQAVPALLVKLVSSALATRLARAFF